MELRLAFLTVFAILATVNATYAPVSFRSTNAIQARNTRRDGFLLRPRSQIELFYADIAHLRVSSQYESHCSYERTKDRFAHLQVKAGHSDSIPYTVSVTAVHKDYDYVLVEDFEHLISSIVCQKTDKNTTELNVRFKDTRYLSLAEIYWTKSRPLLFVTHHLGCNDPTERGVYKCLVDTFDDQHQEARLKCSFEVLGDSPQASSSLRMRGSPTDHELRRRLARRINTSDLLKREIHAVHNDTTFDFASVTWGPKETLIDANGIQLYCTNCRMQGQVELSWDIQVDTDASAIGAAIEDTAIAIVSSTTEEEAIGKIVNDLSLKLTTPEAVEADFNIEVVAEVSASVSGACCPKVGDFNVENTFTRFFGSGQPSFTLGSWQVMITRYIGLEVDFSIEADVDVTFPLKVTFDQGGEAQLSLAGGLTGSGLTPNINFGNPVLNRIDGTIAGSVSIGSGFTLSITSGSSDLSLSAKAGLDMPRFNVSASTKSNCVPPTPNSALPSVLQITYSISFGLFLNMLATLKLFGTSHSLSFDTRKDNIFGLANLYHTWALPGSPVCIPFAAGQPASGLSNTFGTSTPLLPGGSNNPNVTKQSGTPNTVIPDGSLDCSSVQASPGGQPCADAPLQCYGQNVWSCLSGPYAGSSGVVPPGTICACGAFRYPGWQPPAAVTPECTTGIFCVSEALFSVCSPAGVEPAQAVAPGTVCRNGAITWP